MYKLLLIICYLCAQVSYAAHPSLAKNLKNLTANTPTLRIGDGYMNDDRMSVGETALRMDKTKVYFTNMQNSINLTQTIDREELAKELNVDTSVSGGWGSFSGSASASFLRHTENTQFSESFTYSERYYANAVLDISDLPADVNALTPGAANLYSKNGVGAFTYRYGDMFIKELPMGAFLGVNLRLNFASSLDKEKFDGEISAGFGSIFDASATIQSAVSRSKVHGVIEISAYQMGGDPSELPKIFSEKTAGGYYITTCSLENLKDCQGAIDGIIKYAQTNFTRQIKPRGVGESPEGNLVPVGEPLLVSYASKFRLFPAPPLNPEAIQDRLELATLYTNIKTIKNFFDHFLASPAANYLTPAANKLLKDVQFNLDWNWSLFNQFGAFQCYMPGVEDQCKTIIANIKNYSKKVDPKIIDYYINTGFYETQADCTYIPIGTPEDVNPPFANTCSGRWINGIYIFKLASDKSTLEVNGDYQDQGYHMLSNGVLTPQGSELNYSGVANFHNLTLNVSFNHPVSVRITKNKV